MFIRFLHLLAEITDERNVIGQRRRLHNECGFEQTNDMSSG